MKIKVPIVLRINKIDNFQFSDDLIKVMNKVRKLPSRMQRTLISENTEWDDEYFTSFTDSVEHLLKEFDFYDIKEHELMFRDVLKYLLYFDKEKKLKNTFNLDFSLIDDSYYISCSKNINIESTLLEPFIVEYIVKNKDISSYAYANIKDAVRSKIKDSDMFTVEDIFIDEMEVL